MLFEAMAPGVDEDAAKASLRADGLDARALADALAELKARRLSGRLPVRSCSVAIRCWCSKTARRSISRRAATRPSDSLSSSAAGLTG